MGINDLIGFAKRVTTAIDTGKYHNISIAEVEQHIGQGDLIPYLGKHLGRDIDLRLFEIHEAEFNRKMNEILMDIRAGRPGKEWSKWGIKNSGLCLLVVWALEIAQNEMM